jgi:signal transduction histidine kinase/ligand-binding sensor domain-containing protein
MRRVLRRTGALAALLLLGRAAHGVDPAHTITQYGHTAWRVREGFFSGPPTALAQTADGFLWIGTEAGLVRFDGVELAPWKPPAGTPLPDSRIVTLLGASDGSLWIGTGAGLARWDGGKLTVYARTGRFGALLEDRHGTIWAGHTRALAEIPPLCRFDRDGFACLGPADGLPVLYVGALLEDAHGDLWVGGERGACRWRGGEPACFDILGLTTLADKSGVFALAEDAQGTLWAGAGQTGVWQRTAEGWRHALAGADRGLESEAMLADRRGSLWVGATEGGLRRRAAGRLDSFRPADGLSGSRVADILEDREGDIWVATSGGLDRFRDLKVTTLTPREGLTGGTILAVAAARAGGVWIAERRSLFLLQGDAVSALGAEQGLPGDGPTSLLEDSRGRLWVGVDNGLAWHDRDGFHPVSLPDGTPIGVVIAMQEDRAGDLWAATTDPERELVRVHDEQVTEMLPRDRFDDQPVVAIAALPEGGVLLGLRHVGLMLYRGGRLDSYASPPRHGSALLRDLLRDPSRLWLATNQGLFRLEDGKFDLLDTERGPPCNDLESMLEDGDGSLWLKSTCGLFHIPAAELEAWSADPGHKVRGRLFDSFDGVQAGLPPFTPRSARSSDGRLWFAIEEGGLQVLDPRRATDNPVPAPVRLLRVLANGQSYEPAGPLRLPPRTRNLEIDYTALSLMAPEKVRFRYRLEGADGDWQQAGARRQAVYTHLGPGSYRFQVTASNNDGVWNRDGASFAFSIAPVFYETRWFLGLSLAAAAGLGWLSYRWRALQMRAGLQQAFEERLAERTRIARELHDTLLQGVLSSSMQLHVAVGELPADSPAQHRLRRVQQLMAQVIEEGRNVLAGLRSPDRVEDDLERALSRVPGELAGRQPAQPRVRVEGAARPLRPAVRDEIYRVAREALVNAFRHAAARSVEVGIEYGAAKLRVVVRDDGRGIEAAVLRDGSEGHWGLAGMRERAERIGGRLVLHSRAGAGTEVDLTVPGEIAYQGASSTRSLRRWWQRLLPGRRAQPTPESERSR